MIRFLALLSGCAEPPEPPAAALARFDPAACDAVVPDDAPTVQAAVDAAPDGGTVCIRDGTWFGPIDVSGRDLALVGESRRRTILDGAGTDRVVTAFDASLGLSALTIRNGRADTGGGLWVVEGTGATLDRVTLADNHADGSGGAVYVEHTTVDARRTTIVRNRADLSGGGLSVSEGSFVGDGVRLSHNTAGGDGGGGSVGRGVIQLTASEVVANTAGEDGGGLALFTAGGPFVATVIAGNTAGTTGGGVSAGGYIGPDFENVVLAGNRAETGGAVAIDAPGGAASFRNTAIVGNGATDTGGVWVGPISTASFAFSDFWDNGDDTNVDDPVGADGNLAVDPAFVAFTGRRPARWDFHLQASSPLVDAGDPALTDPDGSRSDIGAFGGPSAP